MSKPNQQSSHHHVRRQRIDAGPYNPPASFSKLWRNSLYREAALAIGSLTLRGTWHCDCVSPNHHGDKELSCAKCGAIRKGSADPETGEDREVEFSMYAHGSLYIEGFGCTPVVTCEARYRDQTVMMYYHTPDFPAQPYGSFGYDYYCLWLMAIGAYLASEAIVDAHNLYVERLLFGDKYS